MWIHRIYTEAFKGGGSSLHGWRTDPSLWEGVKVEESFQGSSEICR